MHRRTLLAALPVLAAPAIARAQAAVMRLSHQYPPAHHIAKLLEAFAADVGKRSNGAVTVQTFPAAQLAQPRDNFPGVARGAFEAAVDTNFTWGNTIPEMSAPTIPFLFTELDRIRKFPGSEAAGFLDQLSERRGVKTIGWLFTTRSSIFTSGKAPLINPADFKDVKIRGINPLLDTGLRAAGAAPAATPAPEVTQALATGVLDAGLTDVSAAVSRRYYEVQKFGTVTPYFCVFTQVYVNPRWFQGLAAPQRQAILDASGAAETEAMTLTEATAAAAIGELRQRGMTIHEQTPAETAAWKAVMQKPVIEAFLRAAPEGGQRALDLLAKL
ncbi:MAG: TRAP transporter substrate-binding protein DctP [Acetobacteraceae bacterium]|nr:TRAP transporter substrate-binding protein DctP [Acetobacteraceae bacterium]